MFLGDMSKVLEQVQSGQLPEGRETIADCLVGTAAHLVIEYMHGATPLGAELGHLVKALQNPKDPSAKALPLGMGMMIRTQLSQLEEKRAEFQELLRKQLEQQQLAKEQTDGPEKE